MNRIAGCTVVWFGLALCGCTVAATAPDREEALAGWYWQHGEQELLQPCGQSQPLTVARSPALRERALAFGLEPDMPVYVRVRGTLSPASNGLAVAQVEQFGSPDPVRDCPLTGVVTSTPGK